MGMARNGMVLKNEVELIGAVIDSQHVTQHKGVGPKFTRYPCSIGYPFDELGVPHSVRNVADQQGRADWAQMNWPPLGISVHVEPISEVAFA